MQAREARWPDIGLTQELAVIERVFEKGSTPVRLSALCWMAAVVGAIPPGEVQDQAEDRLAAMMALAGLEEQARLSVRAFRRDGPLAEPWPSPLRPGS